MDKDTLRDLLDAGFTLDELESIAHDIQFGVIAAEETRHSVNIDLGKDWPLEKRQAWDRATEEFLRGVRDRDDAGPDL